MKSGCIIQVRMDSTRFPSKAIQQILGKSLLWHVINRSKKIDVPVIVATSDREIDDPLEQIAKDTHVECFRGSFEDVLDRYYQAAKEFNLDIVYRISADTPLIDPRFCKKMVETFESKKFDYVRFGYNTIGIGMEGITFTALEKAWNESDSKKEREHVTMFIKNNPKKFHNHIIESDYDLGKFHWTVETPYDFKFVENIFLEFQNTDVFFTEDILSLMEKKPSLQKIE
jgi:spore coat polysaccharide biosynthesis protein SpsF (cytidylyltransferase family)